jgi:hypothetical protein
LPDKNSLNIYVLFPGAEADPFSSQPHFYA